MIELIKIQDSFLGLVMACTKFATKFPHSSVVIIEDHLEGINLLQIKVISTHCTEKGWEDVGFAIVKDGLLGVHIDHITVPRLDKRLYLKSFVQDRIPVGDSTGLDLRVERSTILPDLFNSVDRDVFSDRYYP